MNELMVFGDSVLEWAGVNRVIPCAASFSSKEIGPVQREWVGMSGGN